MTGPEDRYYAVIYEEGVDQLTGRERRRWHPAGLDPVQAEALAARLASEHERGRGGQRHSLTPRHLPHPAVAALQAPHAPAHDLGQLPAQYIDLHVLPHLGRVPLRHLRPDHLERLYANLLTSGHAQRVGGLDNKTVLEIHMVLRRALDDAVRRGMLLTNPAAVAHAPMRRPLASAASRAWDAQQLRAFLDSAADHRLHAALWLSANTGMRRGEILGLRWGDVDLDAGGRLSVSRSLVSVGYEVHESRGKTRTARCTIDLDPRTDEVLRRRGGPIGVSRAAPSLPATPRATCSPAPTARPSTPTCCRTPSRSL